MNRIQVLSFEVANLIAAGEVVDRPASAVKEMMENAIDAGATRVTVEIQRGGVSLMRVTDDGCGMSAEDLPMAVRRHATSKIRTASDLEAIGTLGFRGEALAAIAAVSDMRILSKRREDAMGAMLEVRGGTILGVHERGCADGTTVIAENLFSEVPARRKFLKRDAAEAAAVGAVVERVALSHPEIAIRFLSDGAVKLETAGDGSLRSAVFAVFGREFAQRLLPVEGGAGPISVRGFIGRSDNVRPNRRAQHFFINRRYVRSRVAAAALEQAFVSYLPADRYPCCALHIGIRPSEVDVNVHPAKLEVKFSDERPVFEAVYCAVRQALERNTERPSLPIAPAARPAAPAPFAPSAPADRAGQERLTAEEYLARYGGRRAPDPRVPRGEPSRPAPRPAARSEEPPAYRPADAVPYAPVEAEPEPLPDEEAPIRMELGTDQKGGPYRVVGEVFRSYILVERGDRLVLIDRHAAHERLIFERLKAGLKGRPHDAQLLMLPLEVPLMSEEADLLDAYRPELEAIGFTFECLRNEVRVTSVPTGVEPDAASDMIAAIADQLRNGEGAPELTRDLLFERALFRASCKAAVKAGGDCPPEYLQRLTDQLMAEPSVTFCPHGRPVALEVTKRALDRSFKRC